MENLNSYLSENNFNINDDSVTFFSMMKLSKSLQNIKKMKLEIDSPTDVSVYFFKKINKSNVYTRLTINNEKNQHFICNYNYNTSNITDKSERKKFVMNFIEDLIDVLLELKLNFKSFEVNADFYYKLERSKFLTYLKCKKIILCNSLFDYQSYKDFIKNSKDIDDEINLNELTFGIDIQSNEELCNIYKDLNKIRSQNLNITIYLNICFNDIQTENNCEFNKINNLKITFINASTFFQNELFNKENLNKISSNIYEYFKPKYLEIKTVEAFSCKDDLSLFKVNKTILSKKVFLIVNLLNFGIKRYFKKSKISSLDSNRLENVQNSISKKLFQMFDSKFDTKDYPLPLKLNKEFFDKTKKYKRYISNLYMDFKSVMIRKETYETILYRLYNINCEEQFCLRLLKNDCNSFSKILQKIQGNNILFLPDGSIISIGGCLKLKPFKDNNSLNDSGCINKLIIFNEELSKITIVAPKLNELLPHYNSNCFALISKDLKEFNKSNKASNVKLILSGGISNGEFIQNFIGIPIYEITINKAMNSSSNSLNKNKSEINLKIEKIEIGDICNSCLFSHKVMFDDEKRALILYDGYLFNHEDKKGFQVLLNVNESLDKKSNIVENSQKFNIDIYN